MRTFIKSQIARHPTLWEIFKFLLVGGTATLLDFAIMAIVIYLLGLPPVAGTAIGFSVSLIFNFILSCIFVFTGEHNSTTRAKSTLGFILFAILGSIGLLIHSLGMYVGFNLLGINEWAVKIVLTLFVLAFNYITRKKFIFNKVNPSNEIPDKAQPIQNEH